MHLSVHLSGHFNIGYGVQIFHPNSFMPAMVISTIDHYCFISLSVTMTLARGHKVSGKETLLAYIFFWHNF